MFGHIMMKENNETIILGSYPIPMDPSYRAFSNVLVYDKNEKDEDKQFKPFVKNKYLEEENTRWAEDYRLWTTNKNKEIKVNRVKI